MNLAPLFIYGLPVLTVIAAALIGSTRRLGFWLTMLLSLVLTPIGGVLVAMLSGPRRRKPQRRRSKRELERRPSAQTIEAAPTPT